jgi:probable rRNA maturation factor
MILDRQRSVRVALGPLNSFVRRVQGALRLQNLDATICFVSDAEIARMNEAFRKKKGPTDVLSFPAREVRGRVRRRQAAARSRSARASGTRSAQGTISAHLGDIAISPATARRNAKRDGRPLRDELRILILHGMLHLLGYDHETDEGQMNRIEQRLRRRFGLA